MKRPALANPHLRQKQHLSSGSIAAILAVCALLAGIAAICMPFCQKTAWALASQSIEVAGVEESARIQAYKVIEVNCDDTTLAPEEPMFSWVEGLQDWVKTNYPSYIDESGNVTSAFSSQLSDAGELEGNRPAGEAAAFYDRLASDLGSNLVHIPPSGSRTGDGTIDQLDLGSYLVLIDGESRVYRPSIANLIQAWDEQTLSWTAPGTASIIVKSSEVPIDKTVNGSKVSAAQMGDTVSFDITAAVPVYPDNALARLYAIHDALPSGLSLKPETIQVFGVADDTETPLEQDADYTVATEAETAIDLNFDYDRISRYESIRVAYDATLNGNAVIGPDGNVNTASVAYANDPYDESSSTEKTSQANVISYGIEVLKVGDGERPLGGAEFSVSLAADGSQSLSFIEESSGVYRLALPDEQGAETLATAQDGTLMVKGLACGEYYFTETKAPNGYLKLAAPLKATIADEDGDGTVDGASMTPGFAFLQIQNSHAFTLPVTGGTGTALLIAVGALVAASGVAIRLAAKMLSSSRNIHR